MTATIVNMEKLLKSLDPESHEITGQSQTYCNLRTLVSRCYVCRDIAAHFVAERCREITCWAPGKDACTVNGTGQKCFLSFGCVTKLVLICSQQVPAQISQRP